MDSVYCNTINANSSFPTYGSLSTGCRIRFLEDFHLHICHDAHLRIQWTQQESVIKSGYRQDCPKKGNKRRAEQELIRIRSEFEIPPAAGELSSNMLFADYLDQWLEIVRARIKPATFGSYQGMVKSTIGPYFRKKELTLKELEARHIQQFYTEKLKTVTPNSVIHYHAVIYQALKYAMKTDMVPQNVAMKVDRPRKNSFQPTLLDAEQKPPFFVVPQASTNFA